MIYDFYYMKCHHFLLYGWQHVFIIWVAQSFYYMGGQMFLLYGWPNDFIIWNGQNMKIYGMAKTHI